ncbi:transporter substrate-binding domain-containing protein [Legionella israelensis]|uniref:transporter substrate-binding domain-containing protein n=1 Tax=Legionella israelensis TaxID=454 RepID=UPI00117C58EB|nr:transporter substrate-binding domain-containing protein [Legionella israelensis]QDP71174.1 transporter substrate-binding domain-containing protein [Legionella israelensis]
MNKFYGFANLLIYTEQRGELNVLDIMKLLQRLVLIIGIVFSSILYGQGPPLRVAIEHFSPPFIMRASNNQFYGFDISLIENICKQLDRACQYNVMRFEDLIFAVESNLADVAISAIAITIPRARRVKFSLPYLISRSRFLGGKELSDAPFSLMLLNNKKIGVEAGSVFNNQIGQMGLQNTRVIPYDDVHSLIEALGNDDVDVVLLDNPSAVFWEHQSGGRFKTLGMPFDYGFGLAVAVNKENETLLTQINAALLNYQNSGEYQKNYRKYLEHLR